MLESYLEQIAGRVIKKIRSPDKWLYDRRERKLTNEEIQHYCRVVTALAHTIELQEGLMGLWRVWWSCDKDK